MKLAERLQKFLPIHWRTFILSPVPIQEPIERLQKVAQEEVVNIICSTPGEAVRVKYDTMKYKPIGMILVSGCWLLLTQCSCKDEGNNGIGNTSGPFLSPQVEPLSTEIIEIGGEKFRLELAFTEEDRRQGLMFRKELAADRGMIFIFAQSLQSPFHMANCLIDLDILFLHEDGSIVQIATMEAPPPGEPSQNYYSRDFYQYAIELPAGTAKRLQLKVGDKIKLTRRIRDIIPDPN